MEDYEIEKMLNKADSLSENGNYRQAIRIYADAIAYCPSYNKFRLGAAYLGMAVCYAKIGDKDKANEYAAKGYDNYGDFFSNEAEKMSTSSDKSYELRQRAEENYNRAKKHRGESCFVTTAVCESFGKPDDCYELTMFRKFRDAWLINQPDGKNLIAEYYSIAPVIVDKINRLADSAQIYRNIWQKYLEPCLDFIKIGDNLSCKNKYVEMIRDLKRKYI